MSSRIFGPKGESELQPLVWRRVGEATVSTGPPKAPLPENAANALYEAPGLRARIAELEQQIPQLSQQARQAGIQEGVAAAAEMAARHIELIAARGEQAIEGLNSERRKMRGRLEEHLEHLAEPVARRV